MVGALLRGIARPHLLLLSALALLLVAGIIEPVAAFSGFANPAVVAIGALFVVAAGIDRTGALHVLDGLIRPQSPRVGAAVARLMIPTALFSGVLNNTPIVAVLVPRVQAWARTGGPAPSKLLIPLSTAAIVGGWLTLVGTSTNVVVHGLLQAEGLPGFDFFTLAVVGVPAVVVVTAYYALLGHRLLPDGQGREASSEAREYQFDLRVTRNATFAGQTVEAAGFRTLGEAFLARIRRGEGEIDATPEVALMPDDTLTFVGEASAFESLLSRSGLERVTEPSEALSSDLELIEAVVAPGSQLDGHTLRDVGFRERYGGVVVAIRRGADHLGGGLGQVALRAGDLLLIEGRPHLLDRLASSEEFALVAAMEGSRRSSSRAPVAIAIAIGVIASVATGILPLATAALVGALAMVGLGCLRGRDFLRAIDAPVLLVIVAALGIGQAVEATGLAGFAATGIGAIAPFGVVPTLAVVYAVTNGLAELVTNKAAAVLMLPVALDVSAVLEASWLPFAVAVTIGSAASFLTPIGYQTNLMVMGAGGYRFSDFTRAGLPVSALVMIITVVACWAVWL